MAYIFDKNNQSGVLFFFHKCGTTMLIDRMNNPNFNYYFMKRNSVDAFKPIYYDYKIKHQRKEQAYLLIRHPIHRFYSGYWHYWRHWQINFDETQHWAQQRLNRHIGKYSMNVHLDLFRAIDSIKSYKQHDFNFWVHCMHDLADEYVTDMKVVKLGTVPDDKFLQNLLTTKVYNAKYSLENNYDYPELHTTKSERKYINNRYRRAMNLFGYGNDY